MSYNSILFYYIDLDLGSSLNLNLGIGLKRDNFYGNSRYCIFICVLFIYFLEKSIFLCIFQTRK